MSPELTPRQHITKAQDAIKEAIAAVLVDLKRETDLTPESIDIEMMSSGPVYGDPDGDHWISAVRLRF